MGDGYCRIYFPATASGKKWRQDIKIQCGNNAMFRAHRDYPIFDFNLFQIKVADIPYENVDPNAAWYDVYWIRTFKTVDEAIAFAEAEIAAGK